VKCELINDEAQAVGVGKLLARFDGLATGTTLVDSKGSQGMSNLELRGWFFLGLIFALTMCDIRHPHDALLRLRCLPYKS
jgi:hypothetical protein